MRDVDILIVGAGFGGLGLAARLKAAGRDDLVVLDREDGVGGTWRVNTYPGAACDVPSLLYSFSFASWGPWRRAYSPQADILAYLERVADRFDLRRHLRLGVTVERADWDAGAARWIVRTTDGTWRARVLVGAAGALTRPARPDIPGLDTFAGDVMHSARWDAAVPLAGRRVGVLGTGASAIQIVPSLAGEASHLTVFQRTPPWILPRRDRAFGAVESALLGAVAPYRTLRRLWVYARFEVRAVALVGTMAALPVGERIARRHLANQVADPALRDAVTPRYRMGCKRVLLSDDYYPALGRPDVSLVPEAVTGFDATGAITASGAHHPLDALVLCTGFSVSEDQAPFPITGEGGVDLKDAWRAGGQAYLGTAVAGFPNLFLVVGPNTGLGHNSMVFMMERQFRWILRALDHLDAVGAAWGAPTAQAQARTNAWIQRRTQHTVWTQGGCQSWYLTEDGRNTTLWPGFTLEFAWHLRRVRAADLRTGGAA